MMSAMQTVIGQWLYSLKHYVLMCLLLSSPARLPYSRYPLLLTGFAYLLIGLLLVENQLPLDVHQLCRWAADGFPAELAAQGSIDAVIEYIFDRQRAYYQDLDIRFDVVDAVAHDQPGRLYDCDLRIRAVQAFQQHEAASALAAANKRIANILKKQASASAGVDAELLGEAAEQALYQQLKTIDAEVAELFARAQYREGLERLAQLRPAVDRFFDEVMVMSEDAALQNNRLALLNELLQSFRRVADFSRIQA